MADANQALDIASAQEIAGVKQQPASTNLRPAWRPGETGNPNGRPRKGEAFTDILRKYAEMTLRELRNVERHIADLPVKEAIAVRQLIDGFARGKHFGDAARVRAYTYNRVDGMAPASLDVSTPADERMADAWDRLAAVAEEAAGGTDDGSD